MSKVRVILEYSESDNCSDKEVVAQNTFDIINSMLKYRLEQQRKELSSPHSDSILHKKLVNHHENCVQICEKLINSMKIEILD